MTEESERTLILLQELVALKNRDKLGSQSDSVARRKRRKEIGNEIKELARKKREEQ